MILTAEKVPRKTERRIHHIATTQHRGTMFRGAPHSAMMRRKTMMMTMALLATTVGDEMIYYGGGHIQLQRL
jgi:hypothetical protein